MPPPILTPQEIAQIQTEQAAQAGAASILAAQLPAKANRIAELQLVDDGFKKFLDYFNDDIIGHYDSERRALDGVFVTLPIVEQDLIDVSEVTGRLAPTPPTTDIVRVPEFDGNGTSSDPLNETTNTQEVLSVSDILQNGYGAGTPTNALTTTAVTPASTTLSATNLLVETIQAGDTYILDDGANTAVVQIGSIADDGGANPPFLSDMTITILAPPTTSILVGATFALFTGFNNAERTAKIASNPAYQPLMDSLIGDLEAALDTRVLALDAQDVSATANQDPDGIAQLAAALALVGIARTFVQNYLLTTDISDIGLGFLSTEEATRAIEITDRVSEITSAYTGQTENYFDRRYTISNDRGNVLRGTLRAKKIVEDSAVTSAQYAQNATDSADSLGSILS